MTSQIAASVSRVLRRVVPATTQHDVHFHVDPGGRPYVCDYARCESPGLTCHEAQVAAR
jgi:hypothetical protein